jgi:hypothetical protein
MAEPAKRITREVPWAECREVVSGFSFVRRDGADYIYRGGAVINGVNDEWWIRVSPLPGQRARMIFVPSSCNC